MASALPALNHRDPDANLLSRIGRAFRHRNYRLFFGGQIVSLVGTFLTQVAMAYMVYRLTQNAIYLGIVGFSAQIPMFLLAPFAGVWVDRINRHRLIVCTQNLAMTQSFGLAFVAWKYGNNAHVAVPSIIVLSVMQGLINAFDMPARQAFLVEMVTDREDLANAIALNSTMVHASRLVGPALAGLLIHWVGEALCFSIDGVSYLAVIAALLAMTITPRPPKPPRSMWHELMEGLRYTWDFTPIRVMMLLMALMGLTAMPAVMTLMPIFGQFFGGKLNADRTLGFLMAASGAGSLVGALYLASRHTVVGLGRILSIAATTLALGLLAFGASRSLWLSLLILPLIGWSMITCFAATMTMIQTLVDDDKRGRVMSLFTTFSMGMTPFGNLMAGFLARGLGPADQPVVGAARAIWLASVIALIAAIRFTLKLPAIRKIVRPIYVKKGIILEVAEGLQAADKLTEPAE